MVYTITLDRDYGYNSYRYRGDADAIDATNATWIVANTGSQTNLYPVMIDNAKSGIDFFGATIDGTVSQTGDWSKIYINSAAIMVRDTKNASIYDVKISEAWDAIRIAGNSGGFDINNALVTNTRDDAVENDHGNSGTIRNSLFDGVFSGISLGSKYSSDRSSQVVELDNVLIRMESYLYKGQMTHQSPFKMVENSPSLRIKDSVIAIEDPDHIGDWRLELAWDKTISSSNNVFLNLSNKPLPADYPEPPQGWTVLEGQAARDYWENARSEWYADQDGVSVAPTPDNPDSGKAPAPETDNTTDTDNDKNDSSNNDINEVAGGAGNDTVNGTGAFDRLIGGAGNDKLNGYAGNDVLYGGTGNDTLTGGGGRDFFVFNTKPNSSSNVDVITDFKPDYDKIVLDSSVFTSLATNSGNNVDVLEEQFFEVAKRADDLNDYVMYKWRTGEVFYDADGNGSGQQVKIAQLDARLDIDHNDFLIV